MEEIERRRLFLGARTLIAAAALGKLCGAARAEDLQDFSQLQITNPPKPAPDVTLIRADGTELTLRTMLGKPIILNFWATWCPPCTAELPSLDRLAAALSGVTVLAASEDLGPKAASVVQTYYTKHNITRLPVLIDHFSRASDAFSNQGVPTTILIDAKGQVRAKFEGGTDWSGDKAKAKIKELIG